MQMAAQLPHFDPDLWSVNAVTCTCQTIAENGISALGSDVKPSKTYELC